MAGTDITAIMDFMISDTITIGMTIILIIHHQDIHLAITRQGDIPAIILNLTGMFQDVEDHPGIIPTGPELAGTMKVQTTDFIREILGEILLRQLTGEQEIIPMETKRIPGITVQRQEGLQTILSGITVIMATTVTIALA
jgi:hypothetical protein